MSNYDFTEEMQLNDNDLVNRECRCNASQLTLSRRVESTRHTAGCPYRSIIAARVDNLRHELDEGS